MKKQIVFVFFLVLVLAIGFGMACKPANEPKTGEKLLIEESPSQELWRGVMTGWVKTQGAWALIEVVNPEDNPFYGFRLWVVRREHLLGAKESFEGMDLRAGQEILFQRVHVYYEDIRGGGMNGNSDIGEFVTFSSWKTLEEAVKIVNPPIKN